MAWVAAGVRLFVVSLLMSRTNQETRDRTGAVRLTGEGLPFEGRVDIASVDRWGLVCNEGWDMRDADVVCRQLGHEMGAMLAKAERRWMTEDETFGYLVKNVDCHGDEDGISACDRTGIPSGGCKKYTDEASVTCNVPGYKGCYQANHSSFPADGLRLTVNDMTLERCIGYCRENGNILAALHRRRQCYCSNNVTGLYTGRQANRFCNTTCVANDYQACGGYEYLSVYDARYGSCGEISGAVTPPTGETIQADNGTIVSPGFPGSYQANSDCQWLIQVSGKKIIRIDFVMFSMKQDENDWIELRDGPTISSPVLLHITGDKYGHGIVPESVNSTSNKVLVIFKSNGAMEDRGFVINFKAIGTQETEQGISAGALQGIIVAILILLVMFAVFIVLLIKTRDKGTDKKSNGDKETRSDPMMTVPYDVVLPSHLDNETLPRIPSYQMWGRENSRDRIAYDDDVNDDVGQHDGEVVEGNSAIENTPFMENKYEQHESERIRGSSEASLERPHADSLSDDAPSSESSASEQAIVENILYAGNESYV
ncbi:scavenger receptor cysteine-rich domain-containing protein DMBT1-like [Ptychodera flava]|uniref:scavenger receptor cysteine-rich domain-containing protein DMBT1-like n=1 Tax=Ptychodera flava TaxID=63121 RepID=UPI00396A9E23